MGYFQIVALAMPTGNDTVAAKTPLCTGYSLGSPPQLKRCRKNYVKETEDATLKTKIFIINSHILFDLAKPSDTNG